MLLGGKCMVFIYGVMQSSRSIQAIQGDSKR